MSDTSFLMKEEELALFIINHFSSCSADYPRDFELNYDSFFKKTISCNVCSKKLVLEASKLDRDRLVKYLFEYRLVDTCLMCDNYFYGKCNHPEIKKITLRNELTVNPNGSCSLFNNTKLKGDLN